MYKRLSGLDNEFRALVEEVLERCRRRNVIMIPYNGLRDVWTQAKFWRRGRSTREINRTIEMLRAQGANFIASVIESVGPQMENKIVTNALPGESWHQYGLAVDCYYEKSGNRTGMI